MQRVEQLSLAKRPLTQQDFVRVQRLSKPMYFRRAFTMRVGG